MGVEELDEDELVALAEAELGESENAGRKRERSQIEFPYSDLQRAVELCQKLRDEGGQAKLDLTQLAVAMDQSATGGTFRGRLGAAKMFGLIDTQLGKVWLTQLGLHAIEGDAAGAKARAEAFLRIPLYRKMFEAYKGYNLPPPAAIERQMGALGVPKKQTERARQCFQVSANFANFIAANGRFSQPAFADVPAEPFRKDDDGGGGSGGGGAGGGNDGLPPNLHPFIRGLLSELPEPKSNWPIAKQADWLNTAAMSFRLIYPTEGSSIEIKVKGES